MKKFLLSSAMILFGIAQAVRGQEPSAEVYLLTCGPGTETYSIYGHSALRIVIPAKNSDLVYNWGVFDFSAPHFAWRFAEGRLDYMLGVYSYGDFLEEYRSDKRWVVSQKANLTDDEISKLFSLISENLKPENIKYRYDFLYDNCSTRIRDLFEKSLDSNIVYPPAEPRRKLLSFRDLIGVYQKAKPWLNFGINLVLGSPVDKKASFRERMFLPVDLMNGLSSATRLRNEKLQPILRNPDTVLDFKSPAVKDKFLESPFFIFSIILIIAVIFTAMVRTPRPNRAVDMVLFIVLSLLSILMIFFNFFTDHLETRRNFNILWLNPFILVCLASLIVNKNWKIWFRITFILALGFLVLLFALPQDFSDASFPLVVLLILRSSVRSGFSWNPLSLPYLTEI